MSKRHRLPLTYPKLDTVTRNPVVAGIDISTRTGVVVLQAGDGDVKAISHDTVPGVGEGIVRAVEIAGRVASLAGTPDLVVVEGYAYGNKFTLATLVEIGTCVRLSLLRRGIPVAILSPNGLKEFVTGNGNATKKQMVAGVHSRWGFITKDDNQADAYGLARAGLSFLGAIDCTANERKILWQMPFLPCIGSDSMF